MSTVDPKRRSDGTIELSQGCHSGRSPSLLPHNQVSFAVNTTFRGGYPKPRPGRRKINLDFGEDVDLESLFKNGRFQVAGSYSPDIGRVQLIAMIGGRQFRINIANGQTFNVQDISVAGDPNPTNREEAWCVQAENFFIIQDGQSKAFIYNGASGRRAGPREVPVGNQMAYGMGRLWVAKGREYVAGDIVGGDEGTPLYDYRDSVLKFVENTYLAEGGSFAVPLYAGDITGLQFIANLNTALGQGELAVFTSNAVFSTLVPPDRSTWKNLSEPLQRIAQIKFGALSQTSLVNVNGDLFYRSEDGIRSLVYAIRNFGQWPNTPLSSEMNRVIAYDDLNLLFKCSGVLFDNRLLLTASPVRTNHGIYHRGVIALDFDLISSMGERSPPAYDGLWIGLKLLQFVTVLDGNIERCFAFVLNDNNEIELWEQTRNDHFDDSDTRIAWFYETRLMDFGNKFDMKKLQTADLFFVNLDRTVNFDVKYRPDGYACWLDWDSFEECAKTQFCAEDFTTCPSLPNMQLQQRSKKHLRQPADLFDTVSNALFRNGYEFAFRHAFVGYCEVRQCRYHAHDFQEAPHEIA